jgi:hypothetical protein
MMNSLQVVSAWKGDPHKSEEAHKLAAERETNDLDKLERCVLDGLTRAGVYRDDAQVVRIMSSKAFAAFRYRSSICCVGEQSASRVAEGEGTAGWARTISDILVLLEHCAAIRPRVRPV